MEKNRKTWWYVAKKRNSDWYKHLPRLEREAVDAALEHDAHESIARVRATVTFFHLAVFYCAGLWLWGIAFKFYPICFAGAGVIIGTILGALSAGSIMAQTTPEAAKDVQIGATMMLGNIGVVLIITGMAAWALRTLIFG